MTPWPKSDYIRLPDGDGVMKALRPFKISPSDYMVPRPASGADMKSPEYLAQGNAGAVMILTVAPSGPWNMGKTMGMWSIFAVVFTSRATAQSQRRPLRAGDIGVPFAGASAQLKSKPLGGAQ